MGLCQVPAIAALALLSMDLAAPHTWLGIAIVAAWAIVSVWAFILRLLSREDTPLFWRMVSLAQMLLLLQVLIGLVLMLMGRRPGDASLFAYAFHLLYGIVFPIIVLLLAHKWAREGRRNPHTIFGVAGLVLFGLTARAFMVGLGIG